jgi:hypothetical protein
MLAAAAGLILALVLFWVAAQFFGGRFSRFSHSESQGCIAIMIAMLLLLAAYVFAITP